MDESLWGKVAEYCDNDVIATEAVFNARKADWVARQILASLSGLTVNDTTNQHTTRIIFGGEKNPQWQFNYRELWKPVPYTKYEELREKLGADYDFRVWNEKGEPQYRSYVPGEELPVGWSICRSSRIMSGLGRNRTGALIFWMPTGAEQILSICMSFWTGRKNLTKPA